MAIRKLHEPISPYTSSVYNALCTVVQAVPLAALFWMLWNKPLGQNSFYEELGLVAKFNSNAARIIFSGRHLVIYGKIVLVLWAINAIWHRYVIDDQFTAWRLRIRDTLLPFLFATFQCFLALSILSDTRWFAMWVFMLTAVGLYAYNHVLVSFSSAEAVQLFREHYDDEHTGDRIYGIIKVHFQRLHRVMRVSFFCAMVVVAALWLPQIVQTPIDLDGLTNYNLDFLIVLVTTAGILVAIMHDGLGTTLPAALLPAAAPSPRPTP